MSLNVKLQNLMIKYAKKKKEKDVEYDPITEMRDTTDECYLALKKALQKTGKVSDGRLLKSRGDNHSLYNATLGYILTVPHNFKRVKKDEMFCSLNISLIPQPGSGDLLERSKLTIKMSYPKTENKLERALETGWDKSGMPGFKEDDAILILSMSFPKCIRNGELDKEIFNRVVKSINMRAKKDFLYAMHPDNKEEVQQYGKLSEEEEMQNAFDSALDDFATV